MGNRMTKYLRRPHIPGQEAAGAAKQPAQARVVVTATQDLASGQGVLTIEGGRDGQHRQLLLLRALETEMRHTMVFAQRVRDLMEKDPEVKSAVTAYLEEREQEDEKAQEAAAAKAAPRLVIPTSGQVAAAEAMKTRA